MTRIATLPGDGIGPEVMAAGLEVLAAVAEVEIEEHVFGGASIDANGVALTDEVLSACRGADAVLLGRRRRPQVGHHRSRQATAGAGAARAAQGARAVRQPAPGARDRGAP